jgi:hypothetical protein
MDKITRIRANLEKQFVLRAIKKAGHKRMPCLI